MTIYQIYELAKICGFERYTPATHGEYDFGIYTKMVPEINSQMSLTKTPATSAVAVYEVSTKHIGIRISNETGINIVSDSLEEFNKLMRENFKQYFREENINNILNSEK